MFSLFPQGENAFPAYIYLNTSTQFAFGNTLQFQSRRLFLEQEVSPARPVATRGGLGRRKLSSRTTAEK